MRRPIANRNVLYTIEDGVLLQTVSGDRSYHHRCALDVFENVVWAMGEISIEGKGTSTIELATHCRTPFSQTSVALEFLKERGLVDVRHRRCYPACADLHLHAMIEFHALREEIS